MSPQEFAQWIERIYATKEEELDCDQTQRLLPVAVEAELDDHLPLEVASDLKTHLSQCPDCMETYQGLLYVVELTAGEEPPPIDHRLEEELKPEAIAAN